MIIYIAGPITGRFDYKERFEKVERFLTRKGHTAINPAKLPQGLKAYMPTCKALIDQADAVYFMHDWEQSLGAQIEHDYSMQIGNKIIVEKLKTLDV